MIERKTVPVFDLNVWFITDREEARGFIREHGGSVSDLKSVEENRGICLEVNNHRMLCVFEGGRPIVIHESVHMAWNLLTECRIKVSWTQDEPLAYLASWLAEEMLKLIESCVG